MDADDGDLHQPLEPPDQRLSVRRRAVSNGILLSVRGELDLSTVPLLRTALVKALAEHQPAVLVELSHMQLVDELAVLAFHAAARHSLSAPSSQLVLICPDPAARATLRRLSIPRFLPVATSVEEAVTAISRSPRRYAITPLGGGSATPETTRSFVEATCQGWMLTPEVTESAVLIVNELVINSVVHAGAADRLRLEAGPEYLTVAVTDPDPNPPATRHPDVTVEDGHGMHLIDRLATAWGVTPENGGKTVWAALCISPVAHRPPAVRRTSVPAPRHPAATMAPVRQEALADEDVLALYDDTVRRLTGTALTIYETLAMTASPLVRDQLDDAIAQLDQTIRRIQVAAYGMTCGDEEADYS